MAINKFESLSSFHLDVLREIGNIGAGNAATSLASLLADRVEITVPVLEVVDLSDVPNMLGGFENPIVGVFFTLSEDIEGIIMFVFEKKFSRSVIQTLLNKDIEDFDTLEEIDLSVLKEIGNILAASYINALAQLTNLRIKISPPDICFDMAGAVMSVPAAMFGMIGDKALIIKEDFVGGETITSHLVLVPELNSLNLILKQLGVI